MFEELLARLAGLLDRAGIPYMVIGGQAVQLYGEPRLTRDIDLTLGIGVDGLDRVTDVCRDAGLRMAVPEPRQFVQETMVLPAVEDRTGIRVDFVFSFSEYERQAIGRSREVELGGTMVRFAAVEDLVIHKLVAGRPRDVEDVRSILVRNPAFDRDYVARWLGDLDRALDRELGRDFARLLAGIRTDS